MATASEYAQGLRDFATWIENNPDHSDFWRVEATAYPTDDPEVVKEWARAMKPCEKDYRGTTSLFTLRKHFGPVKLEATFDRATVCEKVVTTTEVTETIPDPAFTPDVPTIEVTRTVETVEWVCSPLLAGVEEVAA